MWLRNPFTILRVNDTEDDIQFSTDRFNGDSRSELNPINTGFYYVRSNRRTVALFEKWYGLKDNSTGLKEQDVLQNLERGGALRELNITARFLETRHFSGFCQDSNEFRSVVTVHANCCRYINAKVADLKRVLSDWKKFKESPANETAPFSWSPHDTDVMWLRNPFTILRVNDTEDDIQFSTDWFNGDSRSELNPINTGFYYVRSNRRTVALFEKWYGLKDNSTGLKEQDVLQNLERGGALRELNVTARFLETRHFSGFCQDSKEFRSVVTVHANCCRYINAKVADLKRVLSDWKNFKESPANETAPFHWSPHVNCHHSWKRHRPPRSKLPQT
ncbi:hypothetical protein Nepgr_019037 [Nepenthes gracilis]|uniref:Nucleotide-diphospho-sugar transferase domain-containing protein n=1 Tax=Nepenthes gracilis TaxID=150966 RepID=A0AAD3SW77_NEPGR|nr:hypothetical protein Nepgr_019037 [Nepenthes gracilis]